MGKRRKPKVLGVYDPLRPRLDRVFKAEVSAALSARLAEWLRAYLDRIESARG